MVLSICIRGYAVARRFGYPTREKRVHAPGATIFRSGWNRADLLQESE